MEKPIPKRHDPAYVAEKQRRYRERLKAERAKKAHAIAAGASEAGDADIQRLTALILEAQKLAVRINSRIVADLKARPLDMETARLLDAFDGKDMRIAFARVDIPV